MSEMFVIPGDEQSLKKLTQVVYILYALSYFAGVSAIIGIIINYVKKDDVEGTWL